MKKDVKELGVFQRIIYEYLKLNINDDGSNLISVLLEIEEGFQSVPDNVYTTYTNLNHIEKIEVIHFTTKYILRKKE